MKTHIRNCDVPIEKISDGLSRQILGYDTNLMLVRVNFEKGVVATQHKHPHQQITYIESGKFDVIIGDKTEALSAGDAYVVPSDVLHYVVCLEKGVLIDVFSPCREDFLKK